METFTDVEDYRASSAAVEFVDGWLAAQHVDDAASDFHMNLLAWVSESPLMALGIVMNLIDRVEVDEVAEQVALGPVDWLFTNCGSDSVPVLRQAIEKHAGLRLFTSYNRKHSEDPAWTRFRQIP